MVDIKNTVLLRIKKRKAKDVNSNVVNSNFYQILNQNFANFTFLSLDFYFNTSIKT